MTRFKSLFILIIFLPALYGRAQDRPGTNSQVLPFQQNAPTVVNEEQMAIQFYVDHDYAKARELFEKIYDKKPSLYIYTYLLYCDIELKDYGDAEKLVKGARRNDPSALRYLVDLGYISYRAGDSDKANKLYDEAIRKLPADQQQVFDLANAFLTKNENEMAVKVYKRGRELLDNSYTFSLEIASVYERMGNFRGMLDEYLWWVQANPGNLKVVEDRLQTSLANDPNNEKNEILRKTLLGKVQKEPDNPAYAELMWWYSFQEKDFGMALIQAKSLDRRLKENGERLVQLAQIAVSNGQYDVAEEAYAYLVSRGKSCLYYDLARTELLNTRFMKATTGPLPPKNDLLKLENEFLAEINLYGISRESLSMTENLAHLDAFYLDKTGEATGLLEKALDLPDLKPEERAGVKLELGDILLFSGSVWDATLLYQQVYKDFKNDVIGQTAKFKNAQLSFYIGEYKWAKAQADILKASTSKLISNDAIALSLLISENYDPDSSTTGMRLYAAAELLEYRNKFDDAVATLDSIAMLFGYHPIMDDMLFLKADIRIRQGRIAEADSLLGLVTELFPQDVLADSALMKRAELKDYTEKDPQGAMKLYEDLINKYPGSVYAVDARKRYRILRGDKGF